MILNKIITKFKNIFFSFRFIFFILKKNKNNSNNFINNILFEYNFLSSSIATYSVASKILSNKYKANILAYNPKNFSMTELFFSKIRYLISLNYWIWKSFGIKKIIHVKLSRSQKKKAFYLVNKLKNNIITKKDLEDLTIENIWIGDLIYDSYMREYHLPTIDVKSESFLNFFLSSVELFIFWKNYIDNNNVVLINVSHTCYNLAIPLRIAINRNIKSIQLNAHGFYQLNQNQVYAYRLEHVYPKVFKKFTNIEKENSLKWAKLRIEKRFAGKVGIDMQYSKKSAWGKTNSKNVLTNSKKLKILIATHCFFDSPHGNGINFFTDFFEWFEYLGKKSINSNFEWYVKTHPDVEPGNDEVIDYFLKKYPNLKLIEAETSHHQLISEGINVALTVFGTIGFEYACLNIPVVNASINTLSNGYNFNLNPRNYEEYNNIIDNLDKISLSINANEIYEYYYMKHNFDNFNLFFDYKDMEEKLGGYSEQFYPKFYKYWIDNFEDLKFKEIEKTILDFINTDDYFLHNKKASNKNIIDSSDN